MKLFAVIVLTISTQVFAQADLGKESVDLFKAITHPNTEACVRSFADLKLSNIAIKKDTTCIDCTRFVVLGQKSKPGFHGATQTVIMEIAGTKTRTGSFGLQTYTCRIGAAQ
ncbi:MAG TPA: hypothetical protein VNJ01_11800 [Bacteriovoracaceae bacterium]|nr:hypothetical protein [Bacteriovoracaceae bacterium]